MGLRLVTAMRKEIDKISNKVFRTHVEAIMDEADDFVVDLASSTSGKYHPIDETLPGSNVLHFRRVFIIAGELAEMYSCTKIERDVMLGAALLHDVFKAGLEPPKTKKKAHTVSTHMVIVYDYIKAYCTANKADIDSGVMLMLRDCAILCLFHYGKWNPSEVYQVKDHGVITMSDRLSELAMVFHVADCLAARRSVADVMQDTRKPEDQPTGSFGSGGP